MRRKREKLAMNNNINLFFMNINFYVMSYNIPRAVSYFEKMRRRLLRVCLLSN